MPRAIVLGGTGLVGAAAAERLAGAGWEVVATGRGSRPVVASLAARGVAFARSDRYEADQLATVLNGGADVVVDCLCYSGAHARMLLQHRDDIGSLVMISSKAVYRDDQGRHANSAEPPDFGGPVSESQPTLAPADTDHRTRAGYGPNKAAAEQVLLDSGLTVAVLRPSRVHGVGAAVPREWFFLKRVLDARPRVLLAHQGAGANHPTAVANLAALVELVASRPGTRILNSADPDSPDGLAISRAVAEHLGHRWDEVLLGPDAPPALGDHPWNTWPPFVLDTSESERLGYTPVGTYADTVRPVIDRLLEAARSAPPDGRPEAVADPYFDGRFDYAAEDAWTKRG